MDELLVRRYYTADRELVRQMHGPDPEGDALFQAISWAYASGGTGFGMMQISRDMVQYLASSAEDRAGMKYAQVKILRWFLVTIREAVKEHRDLEFRDGKILYGCFEVPSWFYEKCAEIGRFEEQHRREMRKQGGPGSHLHLLHSDTYE